MRTAILKQWLKTPALVGAILPSSRHLARVMARHAGSAGMLVNDPGFYDNAKMTLQKIDKATEGLEDTGPLSVFGTAINGLF